MPAAAAAAITAGHMIKFSEHAVYIFLIIVNAFNQFSSRTGKWIFFFAGNQLIKGPETVIAQAAVKCFG
jgi:hypothetical protein